MINESLSIGDFLLSPWLIGALILLGIALFIFMIRVYYFPDSMMKVVSFTMVGIMIFVILAVGWLTISTLWGAQTNEVHIELPTLPVDANAGMPEPVSPDPMGD